MTPEQMEQWISAHEIEHRNLRTHLEQELRSKWGGDMKAQAAHTDAKLTKQDAELAAIKAETAKQTPILEKAAKRLGASAKERRRRALAEEIYRTWIKRAVASAIAIGAVLEFFARVYPALKGP